jgi:hypothetical protein
MNLSQNEAFYIVSVMKHDLTSDANIDRHEETKVWLSSLNIPYKVVKGFYKGTSELSFLMVANDKTERVARALARDYEQDCYLYSNSDRSTSLVFSDGNGVNLGTFQRVTSSQGLDSYTVDLESGQVWTVKDNT